MTIERTQEDKLSDGWYLDWPEGSNANVVRIDGGQVVEAIHASDFGSVHQGDPGRREVIAAARLACREDSPCDSVSDEEWTELASLCGYGPDDNVGFSRLAV